MKMLFVSQTPMSGMPWRVSQVCDPILRTDGGWARSVVYDPGAYGGRTYPTDLRQGSTEAENASTECDVVILTAEMGEEHAHGKPWTRHHSTDPLRWIEQEPSATRSTVVAQSPARFAENLDVLPNAVPIDDPRFVPGEKSDDKINIVYTPTSKSKEGWTRKSYPDTMLAFRRILNDTALRAKVNIYLLEDTPFEQIMAARRRAHIVIDECSTGSYHSTTLESLSCGAAVLTWIDSDTQYAVSRLMGKDICLPVIQTGEKEIYRNLRMLIENPVLLESTMKESRRWMAKHYSEQWQAGKWIEWHKHFLQNIEKPLTT